MAETKIPSNQLDRVFKANHFDFILCSEAQEFVGESGFSNLSDVHLITIVIAFQIVTLASVRQGCVDWILSLSMLPTIYISRMLFILLYNGYGSLHLSSLDFTWGYGMILPNFP